MEKLIHDFLRDYTINFLVSNDVDDYVANLYNIRDQVKMFFKPRCSVNPVIKIRFDKYTDHEFTIEEIKETLYRDKGNFYRRIIIEEMHQCFFYPEKLKINYSEL